MTCQCMVLAYDGDMLERTVFKPAIVEAKLMYEERMQLCMSLIHARHDQPAASRDVNSSWR